MRLKQAVWAVGVASAMMMGTAKASLLITVDQSGSDVFLEVKGILNMTGTSQGALYFLNPGIEGDRAYIGSGTAGEYVYAWQGLSGPTNFGTGGLIGPSSSSGEDFAFSPNRGRLYLQPNAFDPRGPMDRVFFYTSSTFVGQTINSLGLKKGIYKYSLPSDSIVVNIGNVSTVPLPASAPLFGTGLIGLAGIGYAAKRKKAAASA